MRAVMPDAPEKTVGTDGGIRFSVVVPVYNAARYLEETAESLLGQRGAPAFELVFVDDGSRDGSGAMLDALQSREPETVRVIHTENRGSVLARQTGIRAARGEYLLFCDADDLMEPDCMKTVNAYLEKTDADILIYSYGCFETGKAPVTAPAPFPDGTVFEGDGKKRFYRRMLSGWALNNLWNKAIRAQMMKEDPTDYEACADYPIGDDLLASLYPVTNAKRIACCGAPLYRYRRTPGGLTASFDDKRYERYCGDRALLRLRELMPVWGTDTPEDIAAFAARCLFDRIDACMGWYRRLGTAEEREKLLERDWFKNLAVSEEEKLRGVKALSLKKRVQYACIKNKRRRLLDVLTRR